MKFLGEQGEKAIARNIRGAAVFCVPFDTVQVSYIICYMYKSYVYVRIGAIVSCVSFDAVQVSSIIYCMYKSYMNERTWAAVVCVPFDTIEVNC